MEHLETALMVVIGFTLGRTWINLRKTKRDLAIVSEKLVEGFAEYVDADYALQSLRRNAFITNERGHRVRYVNASPECRARAEGN